MTFSYDPTSDIGLIRLLIGDTAENSGGPRPGSTSYSDAEITALQGASGPFGGAATVCDALAGEWAASVDSAAGPLRKAYSQVAARWAERATALRKQAEARGETGASSLPALVAGVVRGGSTEILGETTDV